MNFLFPLPFSIMAVLFFLATARRPTPRGVKAISRGLSPLQADDTPGTTPP